METVKERLAPRLLCAPHPCLRRDCRLHPWLPRPPLRPPLGSGPPSDGPQLFDRVCGNPGRGRDRRSAVVPRSRAFARHTDGYGGCPVLVPTAHRARGLACVPMGDCRGVQHSRLLIRRTPGRRLHARLGGRRHSAGSGVAQAFVSARGGRSILGEQALSRTGRDQHGAVDRDRTSMGAMARGTRCLECDAGFLARPRADHSAAGDNHHPARGRQSPSAAWFARDGRLAQRDRSNSRTWDPGPLDHRGGSGARLGLGCRPRAPHRPGHIVCPHRSRRADHRRHPADRRRGVERGAGRDRSQARRKRRPGGAEQRRGAAPGALAHACCRSFATSYSFWLFPLRR